MTGGIDALYRQHAPAVFRRARRLLGHDADAHEVVHDLFLSLFERPEQYSRSSSMTTFLYAATTNACLTRLRNARTRQRLAQENIAAVAPTSAVPSPEHVALLRDALERMPEDLAQVVIYVHLDELTHEDVARILGCSRRHVGDLLERAATWARKAEAAQ